MTTTLIPLLVARILGDLCSVCPSFCLDNFVHHLVPVTTRPCVLFGLSRSLFFFHNLAFSFRSHNSSFDNKSKQKIIKTQCNSLLLSSSPLLAPLPPSPEARKYSPFRFCSVLFSSFVWPLSKECRIRSRSRIEVEVELKSKSAKSADFGRYYTFRFLVRFVSIRFVALIHPRPQLHPYD